MQPHEVSSGKFRAQAKLTASGGSQLVFSSAEIEVTNMHIYVRAAPTTYYVVGKGDRTVANLALKITNCFPHRFVQPWFGPYGWETRIFGGINGLEPQLDAWTLKLKFNDGGAFEFRSAFLASYGAAKQAASQGMDELLPAYSE